MQKAQAVMTLFGVPDAVGHTEGRMFASFGGLQVFLEAAGSIEVGPMKIEARLDGGLWMANSASLVSSPEFKAAPAPAETLQLVASAQAPAAAVVAEVAAPAAPAAESPAPVAAAPAQVSPELAVVPPVTVQRSAFANIERGAKPAAVEPAKPVVAVAAPVAAPAPAPAAASGGGFAGLVRNRSSMPSQVSRPTSLVVPIKASGGAAVAARPRFDPTDNSLRDQDIPF